MDPQQLPLRDIHLPPPPSWWPPAPGWWLLLALSLLLLGAGWLWRRRQCSLRRRALLQLGEAAEEFRRSADAGQLVRRLSLLLRRVALSYHPRPQVAALIGERWLEFLETGLGDGRFREGPGRALLDAPYRRGAEIDGEELLRLCNDWLRALPARPNRRSGEK